MFFDAIFKFVLFWVGDFCWCLVWMFQHQRATEKISEWLGISSRWLYNFVYTLPLSSKPYVLDHTLQQDLLTTQYHFEHAEKLFCNFPSLGTFFVSKSKKTTNHHHHHPTTTTEFNDKKISLLGGLLWLQSHIQKKQVLTFSCIDTLLGLSGPALCLCFTLVPHRTTKLTEGGEGWGKGWRWMAHRGVFFENKLLWSGRGNLEYFKITHDTFFCGVFDKNEWVLDSCLESTWTHTEADVSTYSRTFLPVLSFSSSFTQVSTSQIITNFPIPIPLKRTHQQKSGPSNKIPQNQLQHLSPKKIRKNSQAMRYWTLPSVVVWALALPWA